MYWHCTLFTVPLFIAGICSILLSIYVWFHRDTPGAIALAVVMLAVAEWSLGNAAELGSSYLQAKILWAKIEYLGIVTVPVAWLVFVFRYTGRGWWLTRRNVALFCVVPVATVVLTWTNEAHHLVWTSVDLVEMADGSVGWAAVYGWWFWVHTAYSYLMLLVSTVVLVQTLVRSHRFYHGQAVLMLVGAVIPWVGNFMSISGVIDIPLDLTPVAFALAGLAVTLAVFRFKFLDILPVARHAVVESLTDGVIVLDRQDRIADLNPAVEKMIGCEASDVMGLPLDEALAAYPDLIEQCRCAARTGTEITTRIRPDGQGRRSLPDAESTDRYYALRVSPVLSRGGRASGQLVVLRDVTERKRAEEALQSQKELFEGLVAVARAMTERPTLEATLRDALTTCAALTGAEHGTLLVFSESGAVTHHLVMRGKEQFEQWRDITGRIMDEGLAGWVAKHRQVAVIEDTVRDERWLSLPKSVSDVRSALSVPIISGPTVLAILTLTHSQPYHFVAEHAHLMQAAGDQVVLALRNAQIFDAQQRIAEQQSMLYHFLRAVMGQPDPESVVAVALESIARFAEWPNVIVALLNEEQTGWEIRAHHDNPPVMVGQTFSVNQGIIGRAIRTLDTQRVSDVEVDSDYILGYPGTRSALVVPLRHGERLLGALDIESDLPDAFDEQDVRLVESLADTMALAMENASHYAETRQQATDLGALYTVTRMTSQSLSLDSVLSQALSSVLISMEFEAGLIALADSTDGHLYLAAEYGLPRHLSERFNKDGMAGSLSEYVHNKRESVVIRDFRREMDSELGELALQMARFGLRGYAGIPLLHRDMSFGTMGLFSQQRRVFSANQMVLLEAIGRQVATAVTNARLFQATVNERQRLMTLIESSRDGIILVGLDHKILVVNAVAVAFLRLPGVPEDWTDRPLREALDLVEPHAPDAVESMTAEMARIEVGDEPGGEWEWNVPPRTIHGFNLPVVADKTPLGRLLVLRDVTEERMLAKMRDDLTHTMVHDLRNPLTGISAALKLLDRKLTDALTPAQHRLIEIADHSAQKMIDLVTAILDVSRLESGRMPIHPVPVSLFDLVTETLSLQSPLAAANRLDLSVDVSPELPDVWADAELVRRVLQNLVGNAIKFTPTGGSVKVSATECPEPQGAVVARVLCISVTDTGPGIPAEMQGSLFQKFVVGEHDARGSGLGLAFCKLAVEAHEGRIWVESKPGEGATFSFTLPIAAEDESAQPLEPGGAG